MTAASLLPAGCGSNGRAVVFDFGAVVFHWQPLELLRRTLPAHAPDQAAAERLAETIFQGFRLGSDWSAFDLGQVDEATLARRIAGRSDEGLTAAEVRAVIDAVAPALVADPATIALLRRLKASGHRLAFLSNMPAPYVRHLERENDFFDVFDAGVYSSQIGLMKPDPAFYALAAERLGLTSGGSSPPVFVDDVQANVDAACAIGWDAFVYRDAVQCAAELAGRGLLPVAGDAPAAGEAV